ncbi:MAG: hypothetical protein Kow00105_18570 [Phycisphaeraceae bacterium]
MFWDDPAEATVYHDGTPIYGLDPGHHYCPIPDGAKELWVESICCRTGVWVPGENSAIPRHGSEFHGAYLATRHDEAYHAAIDLRVLTDTLKLIHLPDYPASNAPTEPFGYRPPIAKALPIYRSVLRRLNEALDVYERSGMSALRQALRAIYRSLDIPNRSFTSVLIGHAHIDLVWLWTKDVARFKAVHSFANALSMMERYPEFRFTYSQPASYQGVGELSPGLMDRVRRRVRDGRWEATGAMWVESDTQIPCGEALVRAFELGLKGFLEINGKRRGPGPVVWLPDTFGYSTSIPQIMAGFGVPYFYTTKIHWGSATPFPYTSFRWRGNDGSEVLAHIIQDHYNQQALPGELQKIAMCHQQADVHPEQLVPTGYGDGGGGTNELMIERAKRIQKLGVLGEVAGVPNVKWGRIDEFFDRLNERREQLPVWHGEMYLQYHRGVQTTHSHLKSAYRAAERAMQVWEAVRCAKGQGPVDASLWQRLVFCQFHDCLPGSSIWEVCHEAVQDLEAVREAAMSAVGKELNTPKGKPCVFNPLAVANYLITEKSVRRIKPLAGQLKSELEEVPAEPPQATRTTLENRRVKVRFDPLGQVRSLVVDGKPVALEKPGAQLWTFPDHPVSYDAWDVDRHTLSNGRHEVAKPKIRIEDRGTLRAGVSFTRPIGRQSRATITYRLDPVRSVLLVELDIDWQDEQTLLKMAFPTAYRGRTARYGAPFASTTRPQLPGPIETDAMFEAPASRWAAVSDDHESDGLTIVTEAKYGYGCINGLLHVSLLRSARVTEPVSGAPRRPMPDGSEIPAYSDLGRHRIRLAVGRYASTLSCEDQPAVLADTLFNPPIEYTGRPMSAGLEHVESGPGLVPAWAKPLGRGHWVLRLHETLGVETNCRLRATDAEIEKLNLQDEVVARVSGRGIRVKPYQIVSVGIRRG